MEKDNAVLYRFKSQTLVQAMPQIAAYEQAKLLSNKSCGIGIVQHQCRKG